MRSASGGAPSTARPESHHEPHLMLDTRPGSVAMSRGIQKRITSERRMASSSHAICSPYAG